MKKRHIDTLVIHCTATREDQPLAPRDLVTMHKKRGFRTCGYHYYITRDGEIWPMRPEELIGAHVKGHNRENAPKFLHEGLYGFHNKFFHIIIVPTCYHSFSA